MSTREAVYAVMEQTLNAGLKLDPDALRKLEPLHGRLILLKVLGLGMDFYLIPSAEGIQLYPDYEGEPDCMLAGTPFGFARLGDKERGADEMFKGAVEIRGNTEIGQIFGEVLGGLDIDWEEQLSRITGDVAAHKLGNAARAGRRWANGAADTLPQDLKDYLQEELRVLPVGFETDEFISAVDTLRDDVERLEARIKRLQALPGKSDDT